MSETAYIGVGSNIDPEKHLIEAMKLLMKKIKVTGISTVYRSHALEGRQQADYLNGVWRISTEFDAFALKYSVLRKIEAALGRVRSSDLYASRTIDLDILLFGNQIIKKEGLTVPDPDIYSRVFIAEPLFELAPETIIPDTDTDLKTVLASMDHSELKKDNAITTLLRRLL